MKTLGQRHFSINVFGNLTTMDLTSQKRALSLSKLNMHMLWTLPKNSATTFLSFRNISGTRRAQLYENTETSGMY